MPREGEELSKADRNLASKRITAIQYYLNNSLKVKSIDTYNMAERANWLARMFDTEDAKLKSEIVHTAPNEMTKEHFQLFHDNGKPSGAVAVVIMKNNK